MKMIHLTSFTFLFCAACAGPQQRTPLISTRYPSTAEACKAPPLTLRTQERVVAYPVSRYIDPNHGGIMHERHTVYRVESAPRWNLRPGTVVSVSSARPGVAGQLSPGTNTRTESVSAQRDVPTRDEWLVEILRQKSENAELVKFNQTLEKRISELSTTLSRASHDAEQRTRVERNLEATEARLHRMESALPSGPPPAANDAGSQTLPGHASGKSTKPAAWDW
jgi:hypothetical protein